MGVASWIVRPWLLKTLVFDVRLATRLLREPGVPLLAKALAPLTLLYFVSPLDVLPDILPVLGQMDDLAVAYGALKLFLRLCPSHAVDFHRAALTARRVYSKMSHRNTVIDAEFKKGPS
jgi:uncharacterized membrane protein YkvA (DUF1232 family)